MSNPNELIWSDDNFKVVFRYGHKKDYRAFIKLDKRWLRIGLPEYDGDELVNKVKKFKQRVMDEMFS